MKLHFVKEEGEMVFVLEVLMHNLGTVPKFKMHNKGTVPTLEMHNIRTPMLYKGGEAI